MYEIPAKPYPFKFDKATTALLIIDMQRDFVLSGGFGEIQGGNLKAVQAIIPVIQKVLHAFRANGIRVIHTREGHRPDLTDCPSAKLTRQKAAGNHTLTIGEVGPMGRLLVRGEKGQDIIDELKPIAGEPVIDKPGKGSFYGTDLHNILINQGITHLIVCGVTTECCVDTTVREANDRGYECCVLEDGTDGYNPTFKKVVLDMIWWSDGLFGWVSNSSEVLKALCA